MKRILNLILIAVISTSCNTKDEENTICETCKIEEAYPGQTGTPKKLNVGGQTIYYSEIDGRAVYEGDIILDTAFLEFADSLKSLTGAGVEGRRWPNSVINFNIDKSLTDSQEVLSAMKYWESNTPIRFSLRKSSDKNWVTFTRGKGCSSKIGMIGGNQIVELAEGCSFGNALHEIGHVVGLFHEISRTDRDSTITIHWDNIKKGYRGNFETYLEAGYRGFNDSTFDFRSRMMYEPYSFAKNKKKPTITRRDGTTYEVNWNTLSQGDLRIVNRMYPATR